jgi:ABC-type phosphate/phosphonate transport system substrate-binding protein
MLENALRGSQKSRLDIGPTARKRLPRRILFHLCVCFGTLCSIFAVYAASRLNFFYYNPDSVQSNLAVLTDGFGNYLKESGLDATFQAFAQKADFDKLIKDQKPNLVLVPSWYYQQYGESLGLIPILAALENGKPSYTKVLLVHKAKPFSAKELQGKTVAMTTMGPNTEEILNKQYFKEQGVDFSTMNIIITSKDADAFFALALGQVDAALVGQTTLATIGGMNQRLVEVTQAVLVSDPVPTPILCMLPGAKNDIERAKLEKIFLNGSGGGNLPSYMEILQINGWQKIL